MHAHTHFAQYNKQLNTDLVFFTSPPNPGRRNSIKIAISTVSTASFSLITTKKGVSIVMTQGWFSLGQEPSGHLQNEAIWISS